jgi:hypothetical protein
MFINKKVNDSNGISPAWIRILRYEIEQNDDTKGKFRSEVILM